MTYSVNNGSIYDPNGRIIDQLGFIITIDKDDDTIVLVHRIGEYAILAIHEYPRLQVMFTDVHVICFGFTDEYTPGLQLSKEEQIIIVNHMIRSSNSSKTRNLALAIRDEDEQRVIDTMKQMCQ